MAPRQLLTSLSSLLGATCSGMTIAFTSTLLTQIYHFVDSEKGSWLASINILSHLFGICLGSILLRECGRKPCLILVNVPWFIGWICLSLANDFWIFLIGCLLVGTSAGFHSVSASVYLSETFGAKFQSTFTALSTLFYVFGILTQNFIGTIFVWQAAFHISALIPLLSLLTAFFTLESPEWLILNEQSDRARKIFFWIHSIDEQNEEFTKILTKNAVTTKQSDEDILKPFADEQFLHSLLVVSLTMLVRVFSCFDTLTVYSVDMIQSMSQNIDGQWTTIFINEVAVISCAVSLIFIERMPRRTLFFISSFGVLLSLFGIAITLAFNANESILVICLCTYQATSNIGMLMIPWLLVGEIFPDNTGELGSALSNIFLYSCTFVAVKLNPYLIERHGTEVIFFSNASLLSICLVILYFMMPETRECTSHKMDKPKT